MNLLKTSALTSVSTALRILSSFFVNKIIAVYIGPTGVGLVGQFNNFYGIISAFANGSINQGTVKYSSEFQADKDKCQSVISNSFLISIVVSIFVSIIIILFSAQFSLFVMRTKEYTNIFILVGSTLVLVALNTFILSVLNGLQKIFKFVYINIISSILSFLLSYLLVKSYNLNGAFIAVILSQSLIFFVSVFFISKDKYFSLKYLFCVFNKKMVSKLFQFSLMAIISAIAAPISQILIRNYVGAHISWQSVGLLQGMWSVSLGYLGFITSVLVVYYLPTLSAIQIKSKLREEIFKTYKIVIPVCIALSFVIFIFRVIIIKTLFTTEFLAMKELFVFQLLGDIMKISSWLFGFVLVAKAKIKITIIIELIMSSLYVLLSIVGIRFFGLIGATYAYFFNYFIYAIFIYFYIEKYLKDE